MRRHFSLPAGDSGFLDSLGLAWETIVDPNGQWLLLPGWKHAVEGYNLNCLCVALQISPGYPEAQIDMVYFHPPLQRVDGKAIGTISDHSLDGRTFQRWSRHRTAESPWRPDVDEISTHLALVEDWLARELMKP